MNFALLNRPLPVAVPLLFVLALSTAFIAATFALPYAAPRTLMSIQFAVSAVILLAVALFMRAKWPDTPMQYVHLAIAGVLTLAMPFLGFYSALAHGLGASEAALVVSLAPLCVAVGATIFLGERIVIRHWMWFALGIAGIGYVVGVETGLGHQASVLAPIGLTLGTLYQRRFHSGIDRRTGAFMQFAAAAFVAIPLAWFEEGFAFTPAIELALATAALGALSAVALLSDMLRPRIPASDNAFSQRPTAAPQMHQ